MKAVTTLGLFMVSLLSLAQEDHMHTMDANGKKAGHATSADKVENATSVIGKLAPDFSTVDASGKRVTLASLRKKPVLLVFIEKGCPCCKGGKPYFDRIKNYYGDVANIAGLVVGTEADAKDWSAKNNPQFNVLADPKGAISRSYHAMDGLFTVLISPDGKIDKAYAGYSQGMLRETTARIAKLAKVADRKMAVLPAPVALTSGCALPRD